MKKKIFIIGGSGFIGSKLIEFYLKKKFSVFSISLRKKKNKNIDNFKNFYFDVSNKDKCKKFPYCNQGDINSLEFYEDTTLKEAIKNVAKKTGKPVNYLKNIILKELEDSETGKRLRKQEL